MTGDNRQGDQLDDSASELSRAAAQGPIPGIDEQAEEEQELTRDAAPKLIPEDEAEQVIGFRGLR